MKKKERDIWDDAFRSKFDDFEIEAMPGDWEAIADRLPGKAPLPLHRGLRYWAAAAIITLLVASGGLYLYDDMRDLPLAREIERQNEEIEMRVKESKAVIPVKTEESKAVDKKEKRVAPVVAKAIILGSNMSSRVQGFRSVGQEIVVKDEIVLSADTSVETIEDPVVVKEETTAKAEVLMMTEGNAMIAEAAPILQTRKKRTSSRKWGFGMGGGSFSVGSNNLVPQYVTNSTTFRSESLTSLNAMNVVNAVKFNLPKTDIHHKAPIGVGISINRYLNNRFSLQTGLTYSYLRSEWSTNGTYHVENDQRLHFLGIPLSVAYKIAEWNRFLFYASAGGMGEVNVAGKRMMKLFSDENEIMRQSEKVRMKEWLWSVNARTGVSYPIIRFVSAFAEVGVAYYFDNGSEIETVHAEKPFNLSLQFGFRLGF